MAIQFGGVSGGVQVGCLFHLKQAWQKYLIKKCKFSLDKIKEAMKIGLLDMLCFIRYDEIKKCGIPFLRLVLEKGANDEQTKK